MNSTSAADNVANRGSAPRRGGGHGRGRGLEFYGAGPNRNDAGIPSQRGEYRPRGDPNSTRGRSRGRGRGGRGTRGGRGSVDLTATAPPPPPQPGGNGVLGHSLTKDAEHRAEGETVSAAPVDGDAEAEVCFICASTISHTAVTPCNHRSCHICSLRYRALYKTKACPYCRLEAASVIFTDDAEKRYEKFTDADFFRTDGNLGIAYENPDIFEDTVLLLRYNCPDPSCDAACMGWPDLHRHVRKTHQKMMCDLCTRNRKIFTHEHELFTQAELKRHEKHGDDNPGAIDQSGFQGHPECGFCRQRFFGDDELYAHCREKHERCHLCDRRTGGQNPQYYIDYNALERHFNKDHFPCLDNECQEKKFVVFDSEMDLKAHQLEQHPNGLSKDARRDARRVDISAFDYRPQYQEPRRGGSNRRAGRGRDPNSEPMPAASAGQMTRAELAHQREREIQSAQSVTSRTFGGQLTQSEPQAQTVRRPANVQSPRPTNAQPNTTALHDLPPLSAPASPRPAEALTPQEQARRLRHAAVTERAANLLHNDQMKLGEFRERITTYRQGTISASDLIDAFFSLFDTSSAELGKLIKELADIFEVSGKRDALLKAWSDWKAINEDYPSLPGPAGANATSAAGVLGSAIGGSRVLKLKSSTAQSSRSAMGRQKSWGNAAASANKPGSAFPSLPATNGAAPPAPTPGWLTLRPSAAATSNSASSSAKASPAPSRSQSSAHMKKTDAFPALPAARKPTSTVFSPGYTGAGVIRSNTSMPASAWGGGAASNGTMPAAATEDDLEAVKGKGKGRKKQVLFNWG